MELSFKIAATSTRKQKFSDGFIKRLKPQAERAYAVWDTRQPGLAVVVQPSGHRAFKFVYSFRSRPRWYHIGNAAIPVADARRLAAGVMLKAIEGRDPAAEKKAERQGSTFAELAEAYVERYAKKKNKSWPQADKLVRKHLLPRWGKLQVANNPRAWLAIDYRPKPQLLCRLIAKRGGLDIANQQRKIRRRKWSRSQAATTSKKMARSAAIEGARVKPVWLPVHLEDAQACA